MTDLSALKLFLVDTLTRRLADKGMTRSQLASEMDIEIGRVDALFDPDLDVDIGTMSRAAAALDLTIEIDLVPAIRQLRDGEAVDA